MGFPSDALPVIGLHGAPRSGTTWLGELFNSAPSAAYRYQPFFAHAFRPRVDAARGAGDLDGILRDILSTEDDFILQRGERRLAASGPAFTKTTPSHLVYKEVRYHHLLPSLLELPRFRAVGIVRSPLEVLSSWRRAPREFDPSWRFETEWRDAALKNAGKREEYYGYEGWKRATRQFEVCRKTAPERFRIVRYADILARPETEIAGLLAFAGLPMTAQTAEFIVRSTSTHQDDPYGVFRDHADRRPSEPLPKPIVEEILEDLEACDLAGYL